MTGQPVQKVDITLRLAKGVSFDPLRFLDGGTPTVGLHETL